MDDPNLTHAEAVRARFRRALLASMAFVAALGAIFFAGPWLGDTRALALVPQSWPGLAGVITAPLLHGSAGHWLANASALLILGPLVGTVYPRASLRALPLIWILSGLGTWIIGRPSLHIGASGLTHGLLFLLLFLGLLRRDRAAIAAALIGFFFYGGMLLTVLPREAGISWEYHLSGALAGILAAFVWRCADPEPPRRRYSWEDEPEPSPDADELEPPAPDAVPVLWQRPADPNGVVLPFRPRPRPETPPPQE
ncbi:rhomboid family intramembrane serine protease [Arenimonas terrae]|uniref:Rhomboid family intramembrane serine protease n=1 Tax=Arenimonas terrae TaxID=2546226 RepID=A0A5C4RQT2_9GAMM|nr:rhomboid family intramembrane serine protease [Arenimonas terrae]TNJ33299.1 rhomboid family intramembrane serine protease [Arenimonas terrae]